MKMSVDKQFEAAVNVIQGLPKDGPFQPSHAMMLKFYGYYKQATEGPCNISKPAFYEVVKKAKYEAWNKLGDMTQEEAKRLYVEDIKQIIETMSFSSDVASFTEVLGPFYEYVNEDGKTVEEGVKEEDDSGVDVNKNSDEEKAIKNALGQYDGDTTDEDERIEQQEEELFEELRAAKQELDVVNKALQERRRKEEEENKSKSKNVINESEDEEDVFEDPMVPDDIPDELWILPDERLKATNDLQSSLKHAVELLNKDVDHCMTRVKNLEKTVEKLNSEPSHQTLLFLIAWPFVAHGIISLASKWRKTS